MVNTNQTPGQNFGTQGETSDETGVGVADGYTDMLAAQNEAQHWHTTAVNTNLHLTVLLEWLLPVGDQASDDLMRDQEEALLRGMQRQEGDRWVMYPGINTEGQRLQDEVVTAQADAVNKVEDEGKAAQAAIARAFQQALVEIFEAIRRVAKRLLGIDL